MKPAAHYGCYNRDEFVETVMVQDGYHEYKDQTVHARVPLMVASPFRMSRGCEYRKTDLGKADPRCVGCKRREAQ